MSRRPALVLGLLAAAVAIAGSAAVLATSASPEDSSAAEGRAARASVRPPSVGRDGSPLPNDAAPRSARRLGGASPGPDDADRSADPEAVTTGTGRGPKGAEGAGPSEARAREPRYVRLSEVLVPGKTVPRKPDGTVDDRLRRVPVGDVTEIRLGDRKDLLAPGEDGRGAVHEDPAMQPAQPEIPVVEKEPLSATIPLKLRVDTPGCEGAEIRLNGLLLGLSPIEVEIEARRPGNLRFQASKEGRAKVTRLIRLGWDHAGGELDLHLPLPAYDAPAAPAAPAADAETGNGIAR